MATWDETKPAGTDAISIGDDAIRQFKLDIRERLDNEHTFTATGDNTEGKHLEGSARITTDIAEPLNKDDGRLYYNTTTKLLYVADGAAFGLMKFGFDQIKDAFTRSLVASGYITLPGGLIIQWGEATFSMVHASTYSPTFPIAFPTACLQVLAHPSDTISTASSIITIPLTAKSTTGFTVQMGSSTGVGSSVTVRYIAIGY